MFAAVSPGLTTKNELIGSDDPAGFPFAQLVPAEFDRTAGTNTWYAPALSTYRYGFSATFGVCPMVVYGGFGKLLPGVPWAPTNTCVLFEPVQEPICELRVIHCC